MMLPLHASAEDLGRLEGSVPVVQGDERIEYPFAGQEARGTFQGVVGGGWRACQQDVHALGAVGNPDELVPIQSLVHTQSGETTIRQ